MAQWDLLPDRCRCCGKSTHHGLGSIHTRCISKHWAKHSHGVNASRCKEFKAKAVK